MAGGNISLRGLGEYHELPFALVTVARLAVVLALILALAHVVAERRALDLSTAAALAMCAQLGVMLAGSLSEGHYLFCVIPAAIIVAFAHRGRLTLTFLCAGGVLTAFSSYYVHVGASTGAQQGIEVGAELLFFAAAIVSLGGNRLIP